MWTRLPGRILGAASFPGFYDPIGMKYRMICRFLGLEDSDMVPVCGEKDKGNGFAGDGLRQASECGASPHGKKKGRIHDPAFRASFVPPSPKGA